MSTLKEIHRNLAKPTAKRTITAAKPAVIIPTWIAEKPAPNFGLMVFHPSTEI
jgi:hypothetical protein